MLVATTTLALSVGAWTPVLATGSAAREGATNPVTSPHQVTCLPIPDLPCLPEVPLPEVPVPEVPLPEVPGTPLPEVPELPLPEVPLPEVPEVPEVPLPEVPEVPLPEVPEVPLPEVPEVPLPEVPLPEVPEVPLPEVPLPEVPDPVAAIPLDTIITAGPTNGMLTTTSPTFSFMGTPAELVDSFECSLDGSAYLACVSPVTLPALGAGGHRFSVRAKDLVGLVDASPAVADFTVQTSGTQAYSPECIAAAIKYFAARDQANRVAKKVAKAEKLLRMKQASKPKTKFKKQFKKKKVGKLKTKLRQKRTKFRAVKLARDAALVEAQKRCLA